MNGFLNEGPACFNPGGDTLYFTRNRYQSSLEQRGKGGKSLLRIYAAAFVEGEWNLIGELPLAEGIYSAAHPALSPDGTRLVFASDQMSRGGDFDLMVATRRLDGSWSAPRFLDGGVNTQGNEGFPVFSADGTFHFASDGHPGLGGLDIFRADVYDDSSANCINAGAPFNSGGDDFGLVYDSAGAVGYFSSSRGGIRDRLYKVVRKIPDPEFNFKVSNALGPLPLCTLRVQAQALDSVLLSDQYGSASVRLPKGKDVEVMVSAPGYLTQRMLIRVQASPDSTVLFRELLMLPVPYLESVVWPGIDFLKKQGEFIADAYPALDSLARFLQDNPAIIVEISSFTDARNKEAENRTLTELRCQRIARYLVAKGISAAQFRLRAVGESGIRNRCRNGVHCTEQEHAFNNRIQISIERFPLQPAAQ
ncbi:MAG: OmpA family protein [Bacteroidota bacterium]